MFFSRENGRFIGNVVWHGASIKILGLRWRSDQDDIRRYAYIPGGGEAEVASKACGAKNLPSRPNDIVFVGVFAPAGHESPDNCIYYEKTYNNRRDTMENPNNRIVAVGRLDGELELSHEVMNEPFYTGTLLVKRLSGTVDRLPITIPGKLMGLLPEPEDSQLLVTGQVRSYNKVIDGAGRLMVTLFAQSLALSPDNDTLNRVTLTGALCKPPIYRSTPFGREICDMMLAVNRAFGKSDYIPCIAWGRNAQYASRFSVGDRVRLTGRLQSREYQKLLENGEYMLRNAYEVSCFTLEAAENEPAGMPVYAPPEARYAFDTGGRKHLS